jgi:DNA-directed RNA polymerase subunit L
MEITVLEKADSSLKIRVVGGSQSVLNLLKEEADQIPEVSFAGFVIEHPLSKSSVFVIKTDGKDAEKVFKKILDKTEEDLKAAKKQILGLF